MINTIFDTANIFVYHLTRTNALLKIHIKFVNSWWTLIFIFFDTLFYTAISDTENIGSKIDFLVAIMPQHQKTLTWVRWIKQLQINRILGFKWMWKNILLDNCNDKNYHNAISCVDARSLNGVCGNVSHLLYNQSTASRSAISRRSVVGESSLTDVLGVVCSKVVRLPSAVDMSG